MLHAGLMYNCAEEQSQRSTWSSPSTHSRELAGYSQVAPVESPMATNALYAAQEEQAEKRLGQAEYIQVEVQATLRAGGKEAE